MNSCKLVSYFKVPKFHKSKIICYQQFPLLNDVQYIICLPDSISYPRPCFFSFMELTTTHIIPVMFRTNISNLIALLKCQKSKNRAPGLLTLVANSCLSSFCIDMLIFYDNQLNIISCFMILCSCPGWFMRVFKV